MESYNYISLACKIPEPLCAFAGVYIPHNNSIYIQGGYGDSESKNIYCLNLDTQDWRLKASHTESLVGHSAIELEGRMLIFGGWNEKEYTENLLLFDPMDDSLTVSSNQVNLSDWEYPSGRRDHTLTLASNNIYLLGGWDSWNWNNSCQTFTKLWKLTEEFKWEICEVFGENPSTRRGHSTVYSQLNDELIVFGGIYGYTSLLGDMYILELKDMRWNKCGIPSGPSKRAWHSACCVGSSMYVFGGLVEMKKTSNELFRFDMITKTWQEILIPNSPCPRYGGLMLAVEDFLVILGGKNANDECLNDVHVLDIDNSYKNFKENGENFGLSVFSGPEKPFPDLPIELQVSRRYQKKTNFNFAFFK